MTVKKETIMQLFINKNLNKKMNGFQIKPITKKHWDFVLFDYDILTCDYNLIEQEVNKRGWVISVYDNDYSPYDYYFKVSVA